MKTNHTPGPWTAFDISDGGDRSKWSIVHNGPLACSGDTGDGPDNAAANALLIASAPDLLAALEMARAELTFMSEQNLTARNLAPLVTTIETAIAKAKGGTV